LSSSSSSEDEEEEEEEEEKGGKRRRRGEEREYEEEEERKKNIGTALFTNGGHQGPVKGPARSLAPASMIAHCNAWGRRSNRHHLLGSKAKPWQKLELCVLEECDRSMLNEFESRLLAILSRDGMREEHFQGRNGPVYQGPGVDLTRADDGSILLLTMDISVIWPSHGTDASRLYVWVRVRVIIRTIDRQECVYVCSLYVFSLTDSFPRPPYTVLRYELATTALPPYNRSKSTTRREDMYSMGVKQMGMGKTSAPLLKIQSTPTYLEFQRVAALYYIRQEMIERALVPGHSSMRKQYRTAYGGDEGSCCAIPGTEGFLDALACSVTKDYTPELHLDSPLEGTLECILFTGDATAVFASKCGNIEVITPLRCSMIVLVDSKRVWHAAQSCEDDARVSFAEKHKGATG